MSCDCSQKGHVWLEADGTPFVRHRGRAGGPVEVTCQHCLTTVEMEGRGAFTSKPGANLPPDATIPPQFQKVVDRALADAGKLTITGPAPATGE